MPALSKIAGSVYLYLCARKYICEPDINLRVFVLFYHYEPTHPWLGLCWAGDTVSIFAEHSVNCHLLVPLFLCLAFRESDQKGTKKTRVLWSWRCSYVRLTNFWTCSVLSSYSQVLCGDQGSPWIRLPKIHRWHHQSFLGLEKSLTLSCLEIWM